MAKQMKTNAMRLLSQNGIEYRTLEYEVKEEHLDGLSAARQMGLPPEQVFKTLVLQAEKKGIFVFCIPVTKEIDLKKAAVIIQDKKIELVLVKDLLKLTGYIRGGCSPIGMKKKYPTYIDETSLLFDTISISAGVRGCQLILNPKDLISFTNAKTCEVAKE